LVQVPYWATLGEAVSHLESDAGPAVEDEAAAERRHLEAGAGGRGPALRPAAAPAPQARPATPPPAPHSGGRPAGGTPEQRKRRWRMRGVEGMTRLRERRLRDLEERLAQAELAAPALGADAEAEAIQAERTIQDLRVKLQAREAAAAELRLSLDEWMGRGG